MENALSRVCDWYGVSSTSTGFNHCSRDGLSNKPGWESMIQVFNQYVSPKNVLLMLLESGLIGLALVCGVRIRFWDSVEGFAAYITLPEFALQALVFVITLQVCFYYCQLYNASAIRSRNEQWMALGQSLGSGCLLLGVVYFIFPALVLGRGIFFISLALVPAFVVLNRITLDRIWIAAAPREQVLVLGVSRLAVVVASELTRRNDLNVKFAGFVESNDANGHPDLIHGPILGQSEDLQSIAAEHGISRVIVALEDRRNSLPIRDLLRLKVQGVRIEDAQSAIAGLTGPGLARNRQAELVHLFGRLPEIRINSGPEAGLGPCLCHPGSTPVATDHVSGGDSHSPGFTRADHLPSETGRAAWQMLRCAQVPLYENGCRKWHWCAVGGSQRPAGHPNRPMAATVPGRRTSAVHQRDSGRNELRGSPTRAPRICG